jgi:hypothetical protein
MSVFTPGNGPDASAPAEMTTADRLDAAAFFLSQIEAYVEDTASVLHDLDDVPADVEHAAESVITDAENAATTIARGIARLRGLVDGD